MKNKHSFIHNSRKGKSLTSINIILEPTYMTCQKQDQSIANLTLQKLVLGQITYYLINKGSQLLINQLKKNKCNNHVSSYSGK